MATLFWVHCLCAEVRSARFCLQSYSIRPSLCHRPTCRPRLCTHPPQAGSAARIDFEPLKATPVPLPAGAAFVVSNSFEDSFKAVDAEKGYNRRVTVSGGLTPLTVSSLPQTPLARCLNEPCALIPL